MFIKPSKKWRNPEGDQTIMVPYTYYRLCESYREADGKVKLLCEHQLLELFYGRFKKVVKLFLWKPLHFLLEICGQQFFPQAVNVCEDSLLSFRGRLFETIDVVPQQCGVHSDRTGKFRYIDFLVGEEEPLHRRRLCIFILKTLEADVLIQIPPVDSIKTKSRDWL